MIPKVWMRKLIKIALFLGSEAFPPITFQHLKVHSETPAGPCPVPMLENPQID